MTDPVEKLDRDWDAIVARWDLEGTEDEAVLAAAEAELAQIAQAEPVRSASMENVIAAIEAEVRPMAPVLAMPAVRRWTKVAAAAVVGLLLTAAVTVTVVWWARQNSISTLGYREAVAILAQASTDEVSQVASLMKAYTGISLTTEALVKLADDPATPELLQWLVKVRRQDMVAVISSGGGIPVPELPDISLEIERASDTRASDLERAASLDRAIGCAIGLVKAIQRYAPPTPQLALQKRHALRQLSQLLGELRR